MDLAALEPSAELARLAACEAPWLIGVRHHSPVCAAAIPALLDARAPERLLLELPPDFQGWLDWLGHTGLEAPVALAAASREGGDLAFYPFADFSPELAAVRWAVARGVPVEAFDLPVGQRAPRAEPLRVEGWAPLLPRLLAAEEAPDFEALWDRALEARAVGASPEAIRRAGLLLGWALRLDAALGEGVSPRDLVREAAMRRAIAARAGERTVALVGAFHAAALLPDPVLWQDPGQAEASVRTAPGQATASEGLEVVTSLIPYSDPLLDSRSGYPAGIRDPVWQRRVWEHAADPDGVDGALVRIVSTVCAGLRAEGHPAGVPDAQEAVRVARDLARLRGLPAPGRRELLEALQLALGQGELLGRGRVLARAAERILVGGRRGRLAPGTPRSGLAPHVEALLVALKLPGPDAADEPRELRLDPLRSDLDRRRHVALRRLEACGVAYAQATATAGVGAGEALTTRWTARWTPSTAALLELASVSGVTLQQAARGALVTRARRLEQGERLTAGARLGLLEEAAECGLPEQVQAGLGELGGAFLDEAGLGELLAALALVERIALGHVPGLPLTPCAEHEPGGLAAFAPADAAPSREVLLEAALRSLSGLAGSTDLADARALLELVQLYQRGAHGLGGGRLGWALDELARAGSPLIQGAAGAARVELEREAAVAFGERVASWLDATRELAQRLRGALVVASPRFEADPGLLAALIARVDGLADDPFLRRLPALREGFEVLSPAARERLLATLVERLDVDARGLDLVDDAPAQLAAWAAADQVGREALRAWGFEVPGQGAQVSGTPAPAGARSLGDGAAPDVLAPDERPAPTGEAAAGTPAQGTPVRGDSYGSGPDHALAPADRWRLILGRQRQRLAAAARPLARALDELYGAGQGEGSCGVLGQGGGQEDAYPSARVWGEQLEALFGREVREEVLGRAVERGRGDAALELDPEHVTPSVELLQQVLALKGGLAEGQLGQLRRLVRRVVEQLVQELAVRVRPALSGLSTPRPTRRRGGPLDLRRTVRANLRALRRLEDGSLRLVPERLIFKTRARRSLDWQIWLVVDVSGSMEPSVIYSALMAAILSGLPAVSVGFLAFNTQVIDLSERVDDPLGLLLEVQVGGGTHIAKALRYARERIEVPARTLLLLVSDFEEGWPVGGLLNEVRALVEGGTTCLGLAALDDVGAPRYAAGIAEQVVAAGMPVAALTPLELARWVGEQIR